MKRYWSGGQGAPTPSPPQPVPAPRRPGLQGGVASPRAAWGSQNSSSSTATASAPNGKGANDEEKLALTVSTQSKRDDIGIETLIGDYAERDTNHGRKFYQKTQKIPGHEDVKVFMYYWDTRDGTDFSGWWFGNELGGSQVWAHCPNHGISPPRIGWRIPWDAKTTQPGLLFVDPYKGPVTPAAQSATGKASPKASTAATSSVAAATGSAGSAGSAARLKKATDRVTEVEGAANKALADARAATMGGKATLEVLQQVQEKLVAQQKSLNEAQTALTADIAEARKGGTSATSQVTELSKLSPRIRTLQTSLITEVGKVKGFVLKAQKEETQAKSAEEQKAAEERDSKAFMESMPGVQDVITLAEDSVEAVGLMAGPLIADPPEDNGEALKRALEEIESAANDAQSRIMEARKEVNTKLQGARMYAPETRKAALAEFSTLQTKLTDAQKKLTPYKTFKKEFMARVEAKKSLSQVAEKLASVELEAEKAAMMCISAEQGQMPEDEIKQVEEVLAPARTMVQHQIKGIDSKLRTSSGPLKDELTQMKERGNEANQKLDEIAKKIKQQREGLSTQQVLAMLQDLVEKAEGTLNACQEAEMPFLKGIEVLPADESGKAIAESESATRKADAAIAKARSTAQNKIHEAKGMDKEVAKAYVAELTNLRDRAEAVNQKVLRFKKDTAERKTAALLADVSEAALAAETKVKALAEAGKLLSTGAEAASVKELKAAAEAAVAAEREATTACIDARKLLAAKKPDAKGDAATQLMKLSGRVNAAQAELQKSKGTASSGTKIVKVREAVVEEEERLAKAEEDVEKVQALAKQEGDDFTQDTVKEMEEILASADKAFKQAQRAVEAHLPSAVASLKPSLQKLVDRCKDGLKALAVSKEATRTRREEVLAASFVQEGQKMIDALNVSLEKMSEAELPFLKGVEVLPMAEAMDTVRMSQEAVTEVQNSINSTRNFIASKNLAIKQYKSAKSSVEAFTKMTEQLSSASQALSQFKKDTEIRQRAVKLQEAEERTSTAEAEVKQVVAEVEPFTGDDADKVPTDEELERIATLTKEAQTKLSEARSKVGECGVAAKSQGGSAPEVLSKLQARLSSTGTELSKATKMVSNHQQRLTAKRVLTEAAQLLANAEEHLKNITEAASPLLEHGGEEFLVAASKQMLANVLRTHMEAKELTEETLFAEIGGNAGGNIAKDVFLKYLEDLPEAIKKDEVTFTEDRRLAIFQQLDADKDEAISLSEFRGLFKRTYVCVKSVSVTDVFEVSKSKTIGKLEPGDFVEAAGGTKKDEDANMTRIECTLLPSGKNGWVTIDGNQGTRFLDIFSPFTAFAGKLDKSTSEVSISIGKIITILKSKAGQLSREGSSGPFAEARPELSKTQQKVSGVQSALESLKKKIVAGKRDYAKKEEKEKTAHIEARERKAAETLVNAATNKVSVVEAAEGALKQAANPLTSLSKPEAEAFEKPLSVREEAERLLDSVLAATKDARATIKDQQGSLPKVVSGAMAEARRELQRMNNKIDQFERSAKAAVDSARKLNDHIAEAKRAQAASAIRDELQKQGMSAEQLFDKLATQERVSEDAFCGHLQSVEAAAMPPEHARLICRLLEAGGVGRRRFLGFLQQFFLVVKEIAITTALDVSSGKTTRKADLEEVLEVVEGPKTDEKLGLTRVKAKFLKDNLEGWVTMKGNHGTAYLQEVEKPFIACATSMPLDKAFGAEGNEVVRTLDAEEVLELVEGPRLETFPSISRARGKAVSDMAQGWVTLQDRQGQTLVERSDRYYTCSSSVAMTDKQDVKDCKVVRKLLVGELILSEGDAVVDEAANITRVKGKALKDGAEGWITTKGNAGTTFAEASNKYYAVLRECDLTKKFASQNAETVRTLKEGEAFMVLEGPREEKFEPEKRVKVRAQRDQATGWISLKGANVKPWTACYKCAKVSPMHDAIAPEGATVVREVAVRETIEFIEGPTKQGDLLRVKGRADKDGAIGWVTIKDGKGQTFFTC